jgi:hypothetical protein
MTDERVGKDEGQAPTANNRDGENSVPPLTHKSTPYKEKAKKYEKVAAAYAGIAFRWSKKALGSANFWIAVATIAMAVTTMVYTHYARKQWEAMDSQVKTMKCQLTEMSKQTTVMRQQTVGTYAAAIPKTIPWPRTIGNDLEFLNYTGIGLSYTNVGKVKATNFIAEATLTRQSLPSYKPLGVAQHKSISRPQIRPNDQNGPNGMMDDADIRFDTEMLTQNDLTLLSDSRETLEIRGYFQYEDGFGDIVHEPICFLYVVRAQHVFPSGPSTGGGGGEWFPCDDAKMLMRQAQEWKQGHPKPN